MKTVCRYAIIRFLPFAETGEFANIGIIALDTTHGLIHHITAPKEFPRIERFLGPQGYRAYQEAIDVLRVELGRLADLAARNDGRSGADVFHDAVAPRESAIRFSETRVALVDTTPALHLQRLHARLVESR